MAKKKSAPEGKAKPYGQMIRVSDEFAEAVRKAAQLAGVSQSAYIDEHGLPGIVASYRKLVAEEFRRTQI